MMILTSLTFLFLHTPQFVHPERSQDLSQESGMRRIDKTLSLILSILWFISSLAAQGRTERSVKGPY